MKKIENKILSTKWNNHFFLLCLILLMPFAGMAQTDIAFPKVSEMSPNAASIAQYQDCPVSYYTGLPSINIPLYEIDVDGFKLPITLSYHASGIKVAQEASWVGLGWALNVGGTISRTIKNIDDFLNGPDCDLNNNYAAPYVLIDKEHEFACKGFYYAPKFAYLLGKDSILYPNTYKTVFAPYFTEDKDGNEILRWELSKIFHVHDNEPDVFNYSLPSLGGKFIFDNDRNTILQNKGHNLIFEPTYDADKQIVVFTVIDGNGNKYIFKDVEKTRNYHQNGALNKNGTMFNCKHDNRTNDFYGWQTYDDGSDPDVFKQDPTPFVSCWCLSEIITKNNRHIYFTYEKEEQYLPTQESCERMIIDGNTDAGVSYNQSKTVNEALRLKSIDCDFCHVVFSSSNRLDIKSSTTYPSKKLDCISIYNSNNQPIKDITFDYDYFNADKVGSDYDYVFTRLKLKRVLDNNIGQPYSFSYNEKYSLPAKNSQNTDFWGYYNGREYGEKYNIAAKFNGLYFDGVNKAANPEYTSTYILTNVNYPTGGNEALEYEGHNVGSHFQHLVSGNYRLDGYPIKTDFSKHVLTYNDNGIHEFEEVPADTILQFTVGSYTKLYISCTLESADGIKDASFSYSNYFGTIINKNNNKKKYFSNEFPPMYDNPECHLTIERAIDLEPGEYEFQTGKLPKEVYAEWTFDDKAQGGRISFSSSETNNDIALSRANSIQDTYGGGLRIKAIQSDMKRRTFSYSMGKVLTEPVFTYTRKYKEFHPALMLTSESLTSMSTFNNGNTVGYDWVTETTEDDECPSYTKYHYINDGEYELQNDNFPRGPININYTDGLLTKKEVYWDDALVKENKYDYTSTYSKRIEALYDRSEKYSSDDVETEYTTYYYSIEWPKLTKEVETVYDVNDENKKMTVTKSYSYNDHDLISEEITNDGMSIYKNIIKYPFNFVLQKDIYNQMTNDNIISTPVEIIRLRNDAVIGATRANYQKFNNMFLIKSHDELELNTPTTLYDYNKYYSCKETFDYFDNYGKLRQYTNSTGKLLTYLWGYNYQYPIATIENVKYDDVENVLGGKDKVNTFLSKNNYDIVDVWGFLDPVASGGKMNGYTKIYTYKPLVGMTSQMNINGYVNYYYYDTKNRLIYVKDEKQKTIQKYEYNIKK